MNTRGARRNVQRRRRTRTRGLGEPSGQPIVIGPETGQYRPQRIVRIENGGGAFVAVEAVLQVEVWVETGFLAIDRCIGNRHVVNRTTRTRRRLPTDEPNHFGVGQSDSDGLVQGQRRRLDIDSVTGDRSGRCDPWKWDSR